MSEWDDEGSTDTSYSINRRGNEFREEDTKPYKLKKDPIATRLKRLAKNSHIYISGPMTTGHVVINTRQSVLAGLSLFKAGYIPIIPHIAMVWDLVAPELTYEDWMKYAFQLINRCDALLRIPGHSSGADREVDYAKELGIPVFYAIMDILRPELG